MQFSMNRDNRQVNREDLKKTGEDRQSADAIDPEEDADDAASSATVTATLPAAGLAKLPQARRGSMVPTGACVTGHGRELHDSRIATTQLLAVPALFYFVFESDAGRMHRTFVMHDGSKRSLADVRVQAQRTHAGLWQRLHRPLPLH